MTDSKLSADALKGRPYDDITGVLVLSDGSVFWGYGFGASGDTIGEICFNTSITGYQEILTDPSYAGQIINFTFPHIGNVGANIEDLETQNPAARGLVIREDITEPANYRSSEHFAEWVKNNKLIGISGVDTRSITRLIKEKGALTGVIAHSPTGEFDVAALFEQACKWPGLNGMDLAKEVTCQETKDWDETRWSIKEGFGKLEVEKAHIVAVDYGAKDNILRCLSETGAKVTVVSATTSFDDIMKHNPDGFFLSNGPGDPAATGEYALPIIKQMIETGLPIFGICLGHQLLALAFGGKTYKMHQGHRGANHPVQDLRTGKVEITSMNHGFSVDGDSLPENVSISHISLFDKTVCGIEVKDKPIFSVQQHPEASPGPQDSFYLFEQFMDNIQKHKTL
ncbi:glutamine-hydrolyzing carbamoyl-phosphate synthase small subunit [Kordiimonas sp. SCSIO 12610]|uniref:glutamine-hydrolyzing carbamoyl-phosphate synthase small subunit n=1 Tax=Kordiimonas sp. SCSIO 12610 TaxID=2829597 RepID=UPI002108A9C2|nr:glutamine-hydrolyzing carbamoyl-phosphate synthase small subunit [Kordiimonas sp. SCSIO 12610]UTW54948.1 glutamine-hydrolyzing carbamoyl-phosphate synthase small subunit [Kordiimonas sp. SCSIO 12610]